MNSHQIRCMKVINNRAFRTNFQIPLLLRIDKALFSYTNLYKCPVYIVVHSYSFLFPCSFAALITILYTLQILRKMLNYCYYCYYCYCAVSNRILLESLTSTTYCSCMPISVIVQHIAMLCYTTHQD